MSPLRLVFRSLVWHWRPNLAVIAGVAAAVAVLAGALLVGDSVRASLRWLALERLGATQWVITAPRFVGADLAGRLADTPKGVRAVGLVAVPATALEESSGRRIASAIVYGVDDGFWRFHGLPPRAMGPHDARLSPPAAAELHATNGASILLKLQAEGEVPGSVLFGRRDSLGRTLRVTATGILAPSELGEFALRPHQRPLRAFFVPLAALQGALDQPGRANTILLSGLAEEGDPTSRLRAALRLEDHGLTLRGLEKVHALSLESRSALVPPPAVEVALRAAAAEGFVGWRVLTYLASELRAGRFAVPYSLIAAVPDRTYEALRAQSTAKGRKSTPPAGPSGLLLNEWVARELQATLGDTVQVEYPVWLEEGRLEVRTAAFRLDGIVPLRGLAADPDLTPAFPGISDSLHLSDWDPPFPIDLSRIRPADEQYWDQHRTTPKAFARLSRGEEIFGHRLGRVTSVRIEVPASTDLGNAGTTVSQRVASGLAPAASGIVIENARSRAEEASRGSTDFGAYFLYFSSFLVAAAVLLAALFFRLGLETRQKDMGLLGSVGFAARERERFFLAEGLVLAVAGGLLGVALAPHYTRLVLFALRGLWVGAIGTTRLALEPSLVPLVIGFVAGVAVAALATVLTLRGFRRSSPRELLAGAADSGRFSTEPGVVWWWPAALAGVLAVVLVVLAVRGNLPAPAAFFGAGALLLCSGLLAAWRWLRSGPAGDSPGGLLWLALRGASHRPGRSLLAIGLVAAATFVLVAVSAFRREGSAADVESPSGPAGGYALMAQSLVGIHHDLSTPEGREALGLSDAAVLEGTTIAPFRLRDGDDPSCLNLYVPGDPRILGASPWFLRANRFAFARSLAATAQEQANPWLLLERGLEGGGAIPVVADANTLDYVLHKELGDEIVLNAPPGEPGLRLLVVGALRPGALQGELVVAESAFVSAFPGESGRRFFLIETPPEKPAEVGDYLETRLGDAGFDVSETRELLERYFAVENTYLATFQALGALGLLLGTLGLAASLWRNVAERRRELALLTAVGYRLHDLRFLILSENVAIVITGLALGAAAALLAIAPAWLSRGGSLSWMALAVLVVATAVTGFVVSWLAARFVRRAPLLSTLRSE